MFLLGNRLTVPYILQKASLAKYCHVFEENEIGIDEFLDLEDDHFTRLNLPLGAEMRIKKAIKIIKASKNSGKYASA